MNENIQRYNAETKSLEQPHSTKIRRILDLNRLRCENANEYKCLPIAGYNKTTYTITRVDYGDDWRCNCQGFGKRQTCSHEQALKIRLIRVGESSQRTLF